MPFRAIAGPPDNVRDKLPKHAQKSTREPSTAPMRNTRTAATGANRPRTG